MDLKKLQMDAVNPIEDNPLASGQEDISDIFSAPPPSEPQKQKKSKLKKFLSRISYRQNIINLTDTQAKKRKL